MNNLKQRRDLVEKMKKECNTMIRKCDAELEEGQGPEMPSVDLGKEMKQRTPTETSNTNKNTTQSTTTSSSSVSASSSVKVSEITSTRTGIMANYSYSQNSAHTKVTIYIMQANLTAENVNILVEAKSVAVQMKNNIGGAHGNYIFNKVLYDEVDPSSTSIKYKKDRLQITLKQTKPGEWPELIDKNAKPKAITSSNSQ